MVKRRWAGGEPVVNTGSELAVTCAEPAVNYVLVVNRLWTGGGHWGWTDDHLVVNQYNELEVNLWWTETETDVETSYEFKLFKN